MRKYENGTYRDLTAEELAAMQKEAARYEVQERKRPLTAEEVNTMLIKQQVNTLTVDDQTALRMIAFYPTWSELCDESYTAEKAEFKFTYNGKLYKTINPGYTFVSHYIPDEGTESLFTRIDEEHDGSEFDPIPYDGNMVLTAGLYYTQDDILYLCTRDTGNAVYHPLSELVPLYVELAN